MNAIKADALSHVYPDGTIALSGVDFEANTGDKIAVLGPNGSGKSTLFYHFNGLIRPTGGELLVFGEKITRNNIDEIRKRVGLVFQYPDSQLFELTVFEDIAFGPKNLRYEKAEVERRVKEVLHRLDIEHLSAKNPANLSGGQKKRVAIAGVIAMEPDILVLDEPTSGMDARGMNETMELLDEINNEGKTIIISTHDPELAASWADRVYILNKGKVFRSGVPKKIFMDEKLIADAGLKPPVVVQTFREFHARGISKGDVPLSVIDLMQSIDSINVLNIRCAIAESDIQAGEEISLQMKNGMLVADKYSYGYPAKGIALYDGRMGDDIAVKDVSGDLSQICGVITVVRVPGIAEGGSRAADADRIKNIAKGHKIGAMGTSAKVLLNRNAVRCDFEFDVIQSSILAALRGFDVAIFASGGMAQRAIERIREKNISHSSVIL